MSERPGATGAGLLGAVPRWNAGGMAGALLGYAACRQLSQLLAAVVFFHGSEYALAVAFHGRSNVPMSSLLISKHYILAMASALLEYIIEIMMFPELKEQWWVSNTGLVMVLIGEVIRKAAVLTAGHAFTHNIKIYHEEQHQLVTHGIYRQTPGEEFILKILSEPPMDIVASLYGQLEPRYEEFFLRQFFGPEYIEYAEHVPSGLPFIK